MKQKKQMRSAAVCCMTALLLGTAAAFPASAEAEINRMGDIDGDTAVTAVDAQQALMIYADDMSHLQSNEVDAENYAADIDMNGEIGLTDAMAILQYYGKTLVGYKPMWAEFREVSYLAGGSSDPEDGIYVPREMYVEIGCTSGAPGEDVTVPVYVAGLEGLAGACVWLTPPEGLELTKIAFNKELAARADSTEKPFVFNLENGAAVWVAQAGLNQEVADGTVLIEYTYPIPEDAVPGTQFLLKNEPERTEFVTSDEKIIADYSCTILSGVVTVK